MVTCNVLVLDDGRINYTSSSSQGTTVEQIGMAVQALMFMANNLSTNCLKEAIIQGNPDDYNFRFISGMTHCLQTSLRTEACNLEQLKKLQEEQTGGYSATEAGK